MIMYFWLNHSDKNNHMKRIPVAMKNINHLFGMASEIIASDKLFPFLAFDGTWIDDNKYLENLETATKLIVCTENRSRNCRSILI